MREGDYDAQGGRLLRVDAGEVNSAVLGGWAAARGVQERAGGAVGGAGCVKREGDVVFVNGLPCESDFDTCLAWAHPQRCESGEERGGGGWLEFVGDGRGPREFECADHPGNAGNAGGHGRAALPANSLGQEPLQRPGCCFDGSRLRGVLQDLSGC